MAEAEDIEINLKITAQIADRRSSTPASRRCPASLRAGHEVTQLEEERDFWRNEYDEVIMAFGGKDPRRD